jgi:hypothetical protein
MPKRRTLRLIFEEIYGASPAAFDAPGEPAEAAGLLMAATPRSFWTTLFVERVVGRVSVERVTLHRHLPFIRIGSAPVFRGRFVNEAGRTVLQGGFALRRTVQVFVTLWLCAVGAWCVIAPGLGIAAALNSGRPWWAGVIGGLFFSLAGVVLAAVAYAILKLSKRLAQRDIDRITAHIKSALAGTPPQAPDEESGGTPW